MKISRKSGMKCLPMEKKKNSFITHFIAIGFGTIINMFLGLLSTPIITRIVDPTEYGQFSIFTMYTNIAVMILCLGLDQSLIRFYYNHEDQNYKRGLVKICTSLPIIASTVASIFLIALSFTGTIAFEFEPLIILLLCFNVVLMIWSRIAILLLRITYQSKKYAISHIVLKVVYIALAISLVKIYSGSYLFSLCFATVISTLFQAVYATYTTKELWDINADISNLDISGLIKFGMPLILSMGITTIFQSLDKISLNRYCTYYEIGIYTSAMSLVNIFAIIQSTFNTLWGPMQVEHYVKNHDDTSFIQKGNQYITVIMFFIGFSLILCKDVFALLLGEKYRMAAVILPFLIFNPIMYTISETTCSGIGVSKKSYLNIWVSIGACAVNYVGNNILVPIYGGIGAAISTGVSYIVFFVLRTVFSNKYYYIDYGLKKLSVITTVAIIYAWYNTFYDFNLITIVGYIFSILLLLILYNQSFKEMIIIAKRQLFEIISDKRPN